MDKTEVEAESQVARREKQIFVEMPVPKAVAAMVVPTVISQLITVIYNLADTWYVGLTNNAAAVAAISLCLPVYNIMTASANLFGIGGASYIARALGVNNQSGAKKAFALSLKGALMVSFVYSAVLAIIAKPFLMAIGGDEANIGYAIQYAWVVLVIGGIPTVLSAVFAHLIRSTGNSNIASFGITLGAMLNMVLDPLFMFVLLPKGNEVLGAAIATAISNAVALCFFIIFCIQHKDNGVYAIFTPKENTDSSIMKDIVKCGIPSFSLLAIGQVSNFILNGMIADLGASSAVAGIGIVRKIDAIAYAINQGITQGMLPIVAYCYGSKLIKRMKSVVGFSTLLTLVFSLLCSSLSYIFAPQLIEFFIRDAETVYYGTEFLRVLCIAVAIYPFLFVIIAVFQAVGQSIRPFILSLLNKGTIDIILLFVIKSLFSTEKILWATPISASFALLVGIVSILRFFKKVHFESEPPANPGA